jgi:hypothetical protein
MSAANAHPHDNLPPYWSVSQVTLLSYGLTPYPSAIPVQYDNENPETLPMASQRKSKLRQCRQELLQAIAVAIQRVLQ